MGKFKYGFCEWYLPFSGPDSLRFCKETGYEGIQIGDMGGACQNFPLTNPWVVEKYREASEKTGVELQCLDILSVLEDGSLRAHPDSELGRRSVQAMRKAFEACRMLGISCAFIPSIFKTRVENVFHRKNTAENLRRGKAIADDMGIELLYESFICAAKTIDICTRADGVRLVYDTLNPAKYGFADSAPYEIRTYGTKWIHTVHFKDCNAEFTSDVALGTGVGKVEACAKALNEIGYEGWIVNENTYFKSEAVAHGADPLELAVKDLEMMRYLMETCTAQKAAI